MKKYFVIILILGLFFIPNNTIEAQGMTKNLEAFDEVAVKGNIRLILKAGDIEKLEVEDRDDEISASVDGGILRIKHRKLLNYKSYEGRAIDVYVYYVTLRKIRAEAGARVKCSEVITTAVLDLDFFSGAQASLDIKAEEVKTTVGQGAELELEGDVMELHAKANSGGQLEALRLRTQRVYVKASTGGEAEVYAEKYIEAEASTGGAVRYKGDPEKEKLDDHLWGDIDEMW